VLKLWQTQTHTAWQTQHSGATCSHVIKGGAALCARCAQTLMLSQSCVPPAKPPQALHATTRCAVMRPLRKPALAV
jgi:hypothetical protein